MKLCKLPRIRAGHALLSVCIVGAALSVGPAKATPQFARQTALPCSSCHLHVPVLNAFGERFYANGFRLGKSKTLDNTLPLWASLGAQARTSRSLGSSVPISYGATEIASYGFVDSAKLLYHFEYQPIVHQTYIYGLRPIGNSLTVQAGEIGLLGQYDPRLDISPSRPVYLQPAGAGPLGGGRSGPFAPGANAYGIRIVGSLSGTSAMPFSDGWKVATTVPFSDEAPCGAQPTYNSSPTGVFMEAFHRTGLNSYGVNMFDGRDGRRYYGVVGQLQARHFLFEGGAADALFLGAETRLASLTCTYVPVFDKALSFRIDDQDGFINYVPSLSWFIGGKKGALRLVMESTITKGVAPTTTIQAEFKF